LGKPSGKRLGRSHSGQITEKQDPAVAVQIHQLSICRPSHR
jgi:hypothetical protein